jgi:hypothetical protein
MRTRRVGIELFHEEGQRDGRTDMTKLTVALRNFANKPKNDKTSNRNVKRL